MQQRRQRVRLAPAERSQQLEYAAASAAGQAPQHVLSTRRASAKERRITS